MRILGIDYGASKVGLAITDLLGITAQGLETVMYHGNDKILLKKMDELMEQYEISTIVIGMPYRMDGSKSQRVEATEAFLHKLKCKYNQITIETIDERNNAVFRCQKTQKKASRRYNCSCVHLRNVSS